MDAVPNQLNLQALLRFAIQHTSDDDPTTVSQFQELDPERKKFLESALKHMTVNVIKEFRKAVEVLEDANAANADKNEALNLIRDYVDDLDFANNFIKIDGSKIILEYIKCEEANLRVTAIYIVAELSQNNPFAQNHFTESGVIAILKSYFTENEEIASSSIHALSSLVRNNPPGLIEFVKIGGIKALLNCLNTVHTKVFVKSVFLLGCLCLESEDIRNKCVQSRAIPKLWQFVEQPADGFDVKIENTLFSLSELTKSVVWKPHAELENNMKKLLQEIVDKNEKLPQSEETVAYAKQILENLKSHA